MKYKVLHIIYSLYAGGAERLVETTVKHSGSGLFEHDVCVLTSAGDLYDSVISSGSRVYVMGKRSRLDPPFIIRLTRFLRAGGFDLLHLHNLSGTFWGTLAAWLSGCGAPVVRTEHSPFYRKRFPSVYIYIYKLLSARSKRIICVSEHTRDTFAARYPSLEKKLITIPNGIPLEKFSGAPPKAECRRLFGLPEKAPIVGSVGRLVKEKNYGLLLRAFSNAAAGNGEACLALLGRGPLKDSLKKTAGELGIGNRVFFLPVTDNVAAFYGALDVFVLSSSSEGLPLTLLEAMASSLPVVVTRAGGMPEAVEEGESGFTVESGSKEELASRIADLLFSPRRSEEMGEKGLEIARARYSADAYIASQEKVYRESLGIG